MMFLKKAGLFCALLLVISCSNAQDNAQTVDQQTKYFRHLVFRESLYPDYKGIYPLSEVEAKLYNHYRFVFDEQNRVTEVSYRRGDVLLSPQLNSNWDNFFFEQAAKIEMEFSDDGTTETRRYYDFWGNRIQVYNASYEDVIELNPDGTRKKLSFFDADGKAIDNRWGIHTYEWWKSDDGLIVEQRKNLAGEQVSIRPQFDFYEIRLDYDERGLLQRMYNYGLESELTNNSTGVALDQITYDEHGNFTSWTVLDKDMNPTTGNRPRVAKGVHSYNRQGNKDALETFNLDGSLMVASWGNARAEKLWDEYGNQIKTIYYDANGNLTGPIPIVQNVFDDEGIRLQKVVFYNADYELAVHPQTGASWMEFTYDDQAQTVAQKLYNKRGEEIVRGS